MRGCGELTDILGGLTSEDKEKGSDGLIKFHLPKLEKLVLQELLELTSICNKSGVLKSICSKLEFLHLLPLLAMDIHMLMLYLL